jgi:hypothetical protein
MVQSELDSQWILQDLVAEPGFTGKGWSVARYVRRMPQARCFPFRLLGVETGLEVQGTN